MANSPTNATDPSGLQAVGNKYGIDFDSCCDQAEKKVLIQAWEDAIAGAELWLTDIDRLLGNASGLSDSGFNDWQKGKKDEILIRHRIFFETPVDVNPGPLLGKTRSLAISDLQTIRNVVSSTLTGMKTGPVTVYCKDGRWCDGKVKAYHYDGRRNDSLVFCENTYFKLASRKAFAAYAFHEGTHYWGKTEDHAYMDGRQLPFIAPTSGGNIFVPTYDIKGSEAGSGILPSEKLVNNASTYENFLWTYYLAKD